MLLLAQTVNQIPDPSQGSGVWFYVFAGFVAAAVFTSGVFALRWSLRRGDFPSDLEKFDDKALTIFNEEEPVGRQTDFFPGKAQAAQPSSAAHRS